MISVLDTDRAVSYRYATMQTVVIFLALFMSPASPEVGRAMTATMTAQECAAKIAPYSVYNDENGVRVFMTCETLSTANAKLNSEGCKAKSLDDGFINYDCE